MHGQTDDMVLAAGGLLPADARPPEGQAVDRVAARSYAHAALPGRVVVRLSAESLAQGDDLEMSVLGFGAPAVSAPVGLERRRALGFPAWPIVHDPKNARYALDVVKELKKAARKAKSKPGHAKEAFDALGDTLARSVPHFLPSFFEEVGRAFIDADAQKYAAQYFEKAREAERVHALDIDEDTRRDAFLEFALAGAVAIKSLTAYAKDLEKSRTPEVAYAQFRRLCIQRTLGGMPPWGAMGKDLARLAKLAKRDVANEEASLLGEIVESPSLAKAPPEFWKTYRKSLVALAKGSARVRGTLLNRFPSAPSGEWDEEWLGLLDDCGALDAVYDAAADAASQPSAGAATWISRTVQHSHRGWRESVAPSKLFEILENAAPRLRAEGAPVALGGRWRGRVLDLDLMEHALALGVPVAPPGEDAQLHLTDWAQQASRPRRGLDPVHVAADARFAALFDAALPKAVGTEPFETVARGKHGLATARRAWLDRTIASAVTGAMPSLDASVALLAAKTRAQTYVEFPEPYAALTTIDPVVCLARSLRAGIFDEWGWPAYDAAARDLGGDGGHIEVHGAFPYACLYLNGRVLVISPKERALEHDVRLGKGEKVTALRYAQGQLLVVKQNASYQTVAYWSGAPAEEFSVDNPWGLRNSCSALELPDGSLSEGGRALRAGDRSLPATSPFVSDGTTMWVREWVDGQRGTRLREIHPKTGEKGRVSLPSFFEGWSRDGMTLDLQSSWLVPLQGGLSSSPFGARDGLVGLRVRTRVATARGADLPRREIESIDGRAWTFLEDDGEREVPFGLLMPPGASRAAPVTTKARWDYQKSDAKLILYDAEVPSRPGSNQETTGRRAPMGQLQRPFWHAFVPRDPAGSEALRSIDPETLRPLVNRRLAERPAKGGTFSDELRAALRAAVPTLGDPELATGVLRAIDRAALRIEELRKLRATHDPATVAADPASAAPGSIGLRQAVPALGHLFGVTWANPEPFSAPIVALSEFFARTNRVPGETRKIDAVSLAWPRLIGRIGAVAYLASCPTTLAEERETLLCLLETWAGTIFAKSPSRFRLQRVKPKDVSELAREWQGNDYFAQRENRYNGSPVFLLVEHAASGAFKVFQDAEVLDETRCPEGWGTPEQLRALVRSVREEGPWKWSEAAVERVASETGLTRVEAALLLSGMPRVDAHDANFLSPEARVTMGVKAAEAGFARNQLRVLPPSERIDLFAAAVAVAGPPPWSSEALAAEIARVWLAKRGRRTSIPEALLVAGDKELGLELKSARALAAMVVPDEHEGLTSDPEWSVTKDGVASSGVGFGPAEASALPLYLAWLHAKVPAGDPMLRGSTRAHELFRARAVSPKLLLPLGTYHLYDETGGRADRSAAFLASIGGREVGAFVRDAGRVVAVQDRYSVRLYFRPAELRSEADWVAVATLHRGASSQYGVPDCFEQLRFGLSEGCAAIARRATSTNVPAGRYEACPLHSTPELVARARSRFDLSEEAAVLYLQTLALLAPTAKLVQAWNDWTAARYAKAAADLVAHGLVLEAKRERAHRAHFLPGPWEPLDTPHPPFETWKASLWAARRGPNGKMEPVLGRFVPPRPLHELFAAAWERVERGDVPKYEEVNR